VKSAAASFAKKIPPLTDALTVGPDALAVRACASWLVCDFGWEHVAGEVDRIKRRR